MAAADGRNAWSFYPVGPSPVPVNVDRGCPMLTNLWIIALVILKIVGMMLALFAVVVAIVAALAVILSAAERYENRSNR